MIDTATDTIYHYRGLHGFRAWCRLRIYRTTEKDIVVATEMPDNPGTSITNFVEQLAGMVCADFLIEPNRLVWVEHYPARDSEPENYSLLSLEWNGAAFTNRAWRHINRSQIENNFSIMVEPLRSETIQ